MEKGSEGWMEGERQLYRPERDILSAVCECSI